MRLGISRFVKTQARHAARRFVPWHLADNRDIGHASADDAWSALDASGCAAGAIVWDRKQCVWVDRSGMTYGHLEDARRSVPA